MSAPVQARPPVDGPARRSRRRLLWIVVGTAALLALLASALLATTEATRSTSTETEVVPVDGLSVLSIASESGRVEVVAEDRDDVSVTTRRTSSLWADATSEVSSEDGTLSVVAGCDRSVVLAACSVEHEIAVPSGLLEQHVASVDAGAISIVGSSADVTVETQAGAIRLLDFTGSTAKLSATAGRVQVEARTAPEQLTITTQAGEVVVEVPDETYDVVAESRVGDVELDVRRDSDAERGITVTTQAGRISVTGR